MKTLLRLICILFFTSVTAQNKGWKWGAMGTGEYHDYEAHVVTDASGNTYAIGYFTSSTLAFSSHTIQNNGQEDVYLVKIDPDGVSLWARAIGSYANEWGQDLVVNETGDIFIAGAFNGTLSIDGHSVTSSGSRDIFVAKFNAGGNTIWLRSAGGASLDEPDRIALDPAGNLLVAGAFYSDTLISGNVVLSHTHTSQANALLLKFDAAGNTLWGSAFGGTDFDLAVAVAADPASNVYLAGMYASATMEVGNTQLVNPDPGALNVFLAKYDATGQVLWIKQLGAADDQYPADVDTDGSGNVYLGVNFKLHYSPGGQASLVSKNGYDSHLSKYSPAGAHLWTKHFAGSFGDDFIRDILVDPHENVFVAGDYAEDIMIGTTSGFNASGNRGSYIVAFRPGGEMVFGTAMEGEHELLIGSIAADHTYLTVGARLLGQHLLELGDSIHTSTGGNDVLIARYVLCSPFAEVAVTENTLSATFAFARYYEWFDCNYGGLVASGSSTFVPYENGSYSVILHNGTCRDTSDCVQFVRTGIADMEKAPELSIFPNPSDGAFTIRSQSDMDISITDVLGNIVLTMHIEPGQTDKTLSSLPSGIYMLKDRNGQFCQKLQIVR